jgi:hypothetical protein
MTIEEAKGDYGCAHVIHGCGHPAIIRGPYIIWPCHDCAIFVGADQGSGKTNDWESAVTMSVLLDLLDIRKVVEG